MAPAHILRWIRQAYPKPVVNKEWLDSCCAWIADEMHINPNTQTEAFITEVENQLLESDFRDSMEPGTGLPRNAAALNNQRLCGTSILVEVTAITEIGHSAFNLVNVRQARIERADLAGLAQEEGNEEEEGPISNYPRSMLRLEVSDGTVTMPAIEYRSLPGLKLNETPLGFKILLKDVLVRRGVLFLEPKGIVLKEHKNNDRDESRDRDFLRGLFRRMMKPVPDEEQAHENNNDENRPGPAPPAQPQAMQARGRSPFREISEPPEPQEGMDMDDEADLPRKRRLPNPNPQRVAPLASSSASSSNTLVVSRFFAGPSSAETAVEAATQRLARVLSPVRGDPIDITDSSMEDPEPAAASRLNTVVGKNPSALAPGAGTLRSKISYEEFEFDDDDEEMDAAFLEEVARVEREALAGQKVSQAVSGSNPPRAEPQQPATRDYAKERRSHTPVAGSSNSSSTVTPASNARPSHTQVHRAQAQLNKLNVVPRQEVITIEDDEDDDKENVPVPKRRVRRRVSAMPDDVIDISD